MTTLFVGNLPYTVNDDQLAQMFGVYSSMTSANVIVDKFSRRSKGFGFVQMDDDDDAQKAIADLNGKDIDGRQMNVSVARPREERPERNDRRR